MLRITWPHWPLVGSPSQPSDWRFYSTLTSLRGCKNQCYNAAAPPAAEVIIIEVGARS